MAISAWSQAPRKVHFFWVPIPAYAFLPFAITLFHLRIWTVTLTVVVVGVLGFLSWKGRTVQWLVRRLQLKARAGGMKARPLWYRRRTQTIQSLDVVQLPQLDDLMTIVRLPQPASASLAANEAYITTTKAS
jgi:hypothetical protein